MCQLRNQDTSDPKVAQILHTTMPLSALDQEQNQKNNFHPQNAESACIAVIGMNAAIMSPQFA